MLLYIFVFAYEIGHLIMLKLAVTMAVVSQHPVSNKSLVLPVVEFS
jgi:hypothetical protein